MQGYRGVKHAYVSTRAGVFIMPRLLVSDTGRVNTAGRVALKFLKRQQARQKQLVFPVAFMPGFACNLSCSYCYQRTDANNARMKPRLVASNDKYSQIVDFIEAEAYRRELSSISLSLLGGEPLLYRKDLKELVSAVQARIDITDLHIVTNGTKLTKEILTEICGSISPSLQLTFDGPASTHDKFRYFKSGAGTYSTILQNLSNTFELCKEVGFRINLEPSSVNLVPEIIKDISRVIPLQNTAFSLAPIDNTAYYTVEGGWNEQHFEAYYAAACQVIESGANLSFPGHSGFCRTCSVPGQPDGLVITGDGKLYSCWDSAGQPGYDVGNVRKGFEKDSSSRSWVQCGYTNNGGWKVQERLIIECIKAMEACYEVV